MYFSMVKLLSLIKERAKDSGPVHPMCTDWQRITYTRSITKTPTNTLNGPLG